MAETRQDAAVRQVSKHCMPNRLVERLKKTRRFALLGLIATAMASTGCSSVSNFGRGVGNSAGFMDDAICSYRNNAWSAKAWHRRKHTFCEERHLKDFCNGFRAGYESVIDGGDGRTPMIPPDNYLGWKHQSAEGQSKVSTWFTGYPHGVRAAEEDGAGYWTQVQINGSYKYPGRDFPNQDANAGGGLYPIAQTPEKPSVQSVSQPGSVNTTEKPVYINVPGVDEPVGELAPGEQLLNIGRTPTGAVNR
jgi:hypothetical protein